MKKLDLVRLINEKSYVHLGLAEGMHGIVIKEKRKDADVLFFNPENIGEFAIINVNLHDIVLETETLPNSVTGEMTEKTEWLIANAKKSFSKAKFSQFDKVELVNEEDYREFGLRKGDIGCIIEKTMIQGEVLVFFDSATPDEDGFIDCISVKLADLRII